MAGGGSSVRRRVRFRVEPNGDIVVSFRRRIVRAGDRFIIYLPSSFRDVWEKFVGGGVDVEVVVRVSGVDLMLLDMRKNMGKRGV